MCGFSVLLRVVVLRSYCLVFRVGFFGVVIGGDVWCVRIFFGRRGGFGRGNFVK